MMVTYLHGCTGRDGDALGAHFTLTAHGGSSLEADWHFTDGNCFNTPPQVGTVNSGTGVVQSHIILLVIEDNAGNTFPTFSTSALPAGGQPLFLLVPSSSQALPKFRVFLYSS
jgi:hypothetical protein